MDAKLSKRVQRVKPSPTLAVDTRAKALKAEGRDIINLGAGEPDFDTPEHIKQAAIDALAKGFTKYTAVDGIAGLKQAIIDKFSRDNQLDYSPQQILVSVGGKQSFYNLAQAILDEGDEVIILAPYWVSYPDMVLLADGVPVIINGAQSQGFKITAEQLEQAITPKTRLLVLNSPSNPTGVAYSAAELSALAAVLLKHPQVLIATDDMYEHIMWRDEPFSNIVNVCPQLYERTMVLNGVSKAYAMTGWRIGYAGGPADIIKAMKKIQSQSTSGPTSIAQVAAQAALEGDQGCVADMVSAFKSRHDYVVEALNGINGVQCLPSQGTFYSFPGFQQAIAAIEDVDDDLALAEYMLNEIGVAMVPGTAFGAPGHLRLSFATSQQNLEKAIARIGNMLNDI
ncbi:MAG: pyridoxal phosphate-dependent aminotransferase [Gammaproteobacteria bacterium]|nr:MAG: pyridoxal phosphate-dependent aminotransferase [Gammaproteobacteria bacterium]